ncbi:hypothetical protein [Streptomyces sp. NBC_00154]|uniref:hypothetical protein n=1 Tax=Streptomyces sp. NBC_00154 TaxID=2975670 RepID=UPI00225087CE|nr:hypothetical protein [Streptomyces sp. NBC_00154]MCX5315881.1 hypothetical protein [Streptomyces sp. NBC_00154]
MDLGASQTREQPTALLVNKASEEWWGMNARRVNWQRSLKSAGGQFAVVTLLVLALFALVGLGISYVLGALFGGSWFVF